MEENGIQEELNRRAQELDAREIRVLAQETLAGKGLPAELIGLMDLRTKESCLESAGTLEDVFLREVRRQVDKRLGDSRVPLPGAGIRDEDEMTDREYYALKLRGGF